ncbi:MAG: hypothetical protein KDC12_03125 [Flavobacteriales bacterium]|nr:hypothetical protein [Flavobacteriales bacterium]
MKSIITGVLLLFGSVVMACDHCGMYLNMRPNDFSHFVGIFYTSNVYEGLVPVTTKSMMLRHGDELVLPDFQGNTLRDRYQITELRARYSFNQKWFLWGRIPFVQNARYVNNELTQSASGVGDPMLFVGHNLYNSRSADSTEVAQRLEWSVGVKFPLGATQLKYGNEYVDHDLQPGSGSYDFLLSANYMVFWKRIGLSNQVMYRWNGPNLGKYAFGNLLTDNLTFIGKLRANDWTIMPQAGISARWFSPDTDSGEILVNSGGTRYLWSAGMEINYKNVSIQGVYLQPIQEKLEGTQLPQKNAITINVKYFIS